MQATEGEWAFGVNLASVILFTWSLFCETNFKSEIGFKTVANTVGKKTKEALLAFLNNKTKNVSRVTHQKYIIMVVTLFRKVISLIHFLKICVLPIRSLSLNNISGQSNKKPIFGISFLFTIINSLLLSNKVFHCESDIKAIIMLPTCK